MRVVLVHPQIPQNTGSIARTCAATETPLHLIEPLGFEISEKKVRRAGLDYWPWVTLEHHPNWADFRNRYGQEGQLYAFTKFATRSYHEVTYTPNDILIFGSETSGLPEEVYKDIPEQNRLLLPMFCPAVRSLNLSNAVSVGLYEALRATGRFDALE